MKITSNQSKFLRNFNWLFITYIYRFIIGFITVSLVSRYLGPEKYGIYSYALSLYAFVDLFINVINHDILKKEIIETKERDTVIFSLIIFRTILSLTLFVVTQILLWYFNVEVGERRVLIFLFSFGLFFRFTDIYSYLFSSDLKSELVGKSELITVSIFNLLRAIFVFLKMELAHFGALVAVQKVINAVSLYGYYRKNYEKLQNFQFNRVLIKKLIINSAPLFLSGISYLIFYNIDQIMIGNILDDKSVGVYAIARKLAEPWLFISTIVMQSAYPLLVNANSKSRQELFDKRIIKSSSVLFYSSLGVVAFMLLFGKDLTILIFSDQYMASIDILYIHIFSIPFLFWLTLCNVYEIIVGATYITLIKTVSASAVNVGLNLYLIPKMGVIGASYATVISSCLSAFIFNLGFNKTRKLFILQLKSILPLRHFKN